MKGLAEEEMKGVPGRGHEAQIPHTQDHTGDSPPDGLGLVLEARAVLLTGAPAWSETAQRGARRDLALTTHPRSHICSDTGCCPAQVLRAPETGNHSSVVSPRDSVAQPSLTTSALLSCPAGAWGLGEVLLLPHHRTGDQGSHVPPAVSH